MVLLAPGAGAEGAGADQAEGKESWRAGRAVGWSVGARRRAGGVGSVGKRAEECVGGQSAPVPHS